MTTTTATVLRCDHAGCRATVAQEPRETLLELRIRVNRVNGWRCSPSLAHGGHTDYCEVHA